MLWTKPIAGELVKLALVALLLGGEAALGTEWTTNEGRIAPSQEVPQERPAPVAKPAETPKPGGPSAPIFTSLPARAELHQLLRRASGEAVALVKAKPVPSSWCLTAIASAQAKTGDLEGPRHVRRSCERGRRRIRRQR